MDAIGFRPDQFVMVFPCFAVKSQSGNGAKIRPLDEQGLKGVALILLTDEDLVHRFCERFNYAKDTFRFENRTELLSFLDGLPDAITHVEIDPSDGKPNLVSVDNVIRSLFRQ